MGKQGVCFNDEVFSLFVCVPPDDVVTDFTIVSNDVVSDASQPEPLMNSCVHRG